MCTVSALEAQADLDSKLSPQSAWAEGAAVICDRLEQRAVMARRKCSMTFATIDRYRRVPTR